MIYTQTVCTMLHNSFYDKLATRRSEVTAAEDQMRLLHTGVGAAVSKFMAILTTKQPKNTDTKNPLLAYQSLIHALGNKRLRVSHLLTLLEVFFPQHSPLTNFSTYRVELIVYFSR
jgi:hypothetical protein